MSFDPDKPYNDLPLLPPRAELETKAVLRKAIAANKALAELKGAGDLIPNQGILINAIVLQEAKLSSEIENKEPTSMFAKRTYCENMSKKAGFLDMFQKHVQHVDISFGSTRRFGFGAILVLRHKKRLCGAIPLSRHINAGGAKHEVKR